MEPAHEAAPAPRPGPAQSRPLSGARAGPAAGSPAGLGVGRRRAPARGGPRQSPPSPSRSGKPRLGPRRHRQVMELPRGAAPARLSPPPPPPALPASPHGFPALRRRLSAGTEGAAPPLVVAGLPAPGPALGIPFKSPARPAWLWEPRHGISMDFSSWVVWWSLPLACGPRQLKDGPRVRRLPRQCRSGVQSRYSWFSYVIWECRAEVGDRCEDFCIKH